MKCRTCQREFPANTVSGTVAGKTISLTQINCPKCILKRFPNPALKSK